MRILHVHGKYYAEGGGETYLRSLIHSQLTEGQEPAILYADSRPAEIMQLCQTYFCSASHGLRSGWHALPQFKKAVTSFAPDVIHLHVVQYDISPLILHWLTQNYPTLMTMHDTLTLCPKPLTAKKPEQTARILPNCRPCTYAMGGACFKTGCMRIMLATEGFWKSTVALIEKFWRKKIYCSLAKIIVNSSFTKMDLVNNRIPAKNIDILPAPLNIPDTWKNPALKPAVELPHLLFVGQLSMVKGADEFLSVLGQLKDMPWKASMIGDGPDRNAIEQKIKQCGLEGRVILHGYIARDAIGDFYKQAHLLLFPTLAPESLGLVGIEAMWFGLPVVAYDVGAVKEWLKDEKTGYLVPPGNIAAMARQVRTLLTDQSLYERFQIQAKKSAEGWLDYDKHKLAFSKLYASVRGGKQC